GSDESIGSLSNYWAYGVRFRHGPSGSDVLPTITAEGGNGYLQVNTARYPEGFHLIADLTAPAYGASLDVSSAAGRTLRVVARGLDGGIVAEVTSEAVPG